MLLLLLTLAAARAGADTILFGTPQMFDGNRGARAQSTLFCRGQSLFHALNCSAAYLLASYTGGDDAASLPVNQTAPVVGPTGVHLAANYSQMFLGAALNNTLADADVLPRGTPWWSGSTGAGTASDNCGNWADDSSSCENA